MAESLGASCYTIWYVANIKGGGGAGNGQRCRLDCFGISGAQQCLAHSRYSETIAAMEFCNLLLGLTECWARGSSQ